MFRSLANKSMVHTPALRSMMTTRYFSLSSRTYEKSVEKTTASETTKATPPPETSTRVAPPRVLSSFDKKILVWTGKYKTAEEIPNNVA